MKQQFRSLADEFSPTKVRKEIQRVGEEWKTIKEKRALKTKEAEPRSVEPVSQLCAQCSNFDIKSLMATFTPNVQIPRTSTVDHNRRVSLGLLDEILLTQGCSLCRLVTQAVLEGWQSSSQSIYGYRDQDGNALCIYLCTQYRSFESQDIQTLERRQGGHLRKHPLPYGGVLFIEVDTTIPHFMDSLTRIKADFRKLDFRYQALLQARKHLKIQDQIYQPQIRLLVDDAELISVDTSTLDVKNTSVKTFGLGRFIEPQLNFKLAREWIDTCLDNHNSCSGIGMSPAEGSKALRRPPFMRLIDILNMNVISALPNSEYAALSYVWGKSQHRLEATKANYLSLEEKDSLLKHQLPRTIEDAIQVAKKLDLRYLWIDGLCIIQDSLDHKKSQIKVMDEVYATATVTIVAASGEHADSGLPGVSLVTGSPFMPMYVQGLRFIVSPGPIDAQLTSSKWHTRAWCYQEWKLSKRLLFFTTYQVYFTCQTASFCESIDCFGFSDKKDKLVPVPQEVPENSLSSSTRKHWEEWSWPSFKLKLHEYTTRQLSYESDVLNAFSGVLAKMQTNSRQDIVGGLPSNELLRGMLWQPGAPIRRRSYISFPFPAWSWIGWVGATNFQSFSHWVEPTVPEFFHRDSSNCLVSLGAGIEKDQKLDNEPFDPYAKGVINDSVYETHWNTEPALQNCNGCELLTTERFLTSPEAKESLKLTKVVLFPTELTNPYRFEYALESSLTEEEKLSIFQNTSIAYTVHDTMQESIRENGVLQFYTEIATLTISPENSMPVPRQTESVSVHEPFPRNTALRYFQLVDQNNKNQWIGIVQLPHDFFTSNYRRQYEFIILCGAKLRRRGWEEHPHKHVGAYFLDKKKISYYWDEGKMYTLAWNVMMVEYRRGIAYRLGLGKVHYSAWEAACPKKEVVTLG